MLATSPEGEGRDSDNNQQYPHARLLMLKSLQDEDSSEKKKVDIEVSEIVALQRQVQFLTFLFSSCFTLTRLRCSFTL